MTDSRGGSRGVQGVRTPALCLGCPFLKSTFSKHVLAEQGASRLMILEQRCALLINFRIKFKFNLIFAGAPSIHSLVAFLSMLLFNTNSNVIYAFESGPDLTMLLFFMTVSKNYFDI